MPEATTILQAGAIPFRCTRRGVFEVLLVTTTSGRWLIPKGGIDEGCTPEDAARIETREEAGVVGVVEGGAIGEFAYLKRGLPHVVRVYPLRVQRTLTRWEEQGVRDRAWLHVEAAAERVALPEIGAMIREMPGFVRALRSDAA